MGVFFDSAKALTYRTTQPTSWTTNFGTKVGTGNKASGREGVVLYTSNATTIRGQAAIYGSTIVQTSNSTLAFAPAVSGANFEMIECRVGNKGTTSGATISVGTASGLQLSNIYNVDFWGELVSASAGLLTTFGATTIERCTIAINGAAFFVKSAQATLSAKDIVFFGTPGTADIGYSGNGIGNVWTLVNIGWSGNAAKFSSMTSPQGNIVEYRIGDMKVGDVNGTPVSGQPAKMTDVTGAVAFNTTTDANGRVAFGSGILTNAVPVADHYGTASYVTASRGPYLVEVAGQRYYAMWPSDVNGNYEDMADLVPTQFASGNSTTWVENSL